MKTGTVKDFNSTIGEDNIFLDSKAVDGEECKSLGKTEVLFKFEQEVKCWQINNVSEA